MRQITLPKSYYAISIITLSLLLVWIKERKYHVTWWTMCRSKGRITLCLANALGMWFQTFCHQNTFRTFKILRSLYLFYLPIFKVFKIKISLYLKYLVIPRFYYGRWAQNGIYKWYIIELYPWNLYILIN